MGGGDFTEEISLRDPDAFYARLISLHDGLDAEASNRLNAAIILMMANQIGDDAVLGNILERAGTLFAAK